MKYPKTILMKIDNLFSTSFARNIRMRGAVGITASGQMRILCAIAAPACVSNCQKNGQREIFVFLFFF